jgi:pimeloyl-ACP methyl ester carboxylesterase
MMTRALLFVALAAIAAVAFSQFLRRTSMFFPSREGNFDTTRFAIRPEDRTFTTSDGVRLHGWLFRADATAPTLIWYHGNAGNLTDRAEMAVHLARRGINVFLFDYRGYGKSEGRPSEKKLLLDALAAYDHIGGENVVLYGESVGGPYAAWAAKHRRPRAVIIENSFPSLRALGNHLYAPLPLGWTAPFALDTTRWLNDAGVPVLVMHGRADRVIPYEFGEQLHRELRVPKELMTCETAGHCEIPFVESARYYDTVTRFVRAQTAMR